MPKRQRLKKTPRKRATARPRRIRNVPITPKAVFRLIATQALQALLSYLLGELGLTGPEIVASIYPLLGYLPAASQRAAAINWLLEVFTVDGITPKDQ